MKVCLKNSSKFFLNLHIWINSSFYSCFSPTLTDEIADIVNACGEKFVAASMMGQTPSHESIAFHTRRREFAVTLFYRVLENVINKEQPQNHRVRILH